MVTIKNDIESSSGAFIPTSSHQPVKDVNLKQEGARLSRRRSYRCVTIVSVVVLVLMGLGIGGVLYFGKTLKRTPTQVKDGMPSTTTEAVPEEPTVSPPTFTDPYDGTETSVGPTDDDDEFDIDGPVDSSTSSTPSTTTMTSRWKLWSDEGSGSEDDDYYDSGSGDSLVI
ncbi:AAEL012853-PA [Aedes aegypti]|uniref:AAEL012853-PA n=1 Tax=Aedes aegypti TaxID=7159 RepID=Q16KV7_AEDAE|nr:AAEL012853-PA [Aedes aegypti]